MSVIDVHAHILPGVDDGPSSIEGVLQMLELAHRGGTRGMIATPHMFLPPYNNHDLVALTDVFAELVRELRRRSRQPEFAFLEEMSLYLGSENYFSPGFLKALEGGRVLPLNGSFYLLVEFSDFLPVQMVTLAMERIVGAGFVPVLAHVERYAPFRENPGTLEQLVQSGCVAQLNSSSLLGAEGRSPRKVALSFLRRGLVHLIASDAHGSRRRAPALGSVSQVLRKRRFSESEIAKWTNDNPRRILENAGLT